MRAFSSVFIMLALVGCGGKTRGGDSPTPRASQTRFDTDPGLAAPTGLSTFIKSTRAGVYVTWEYAGDADGFLVETLLEGPTIDSAGWVEAAVVDGRARAYALSLDLRQLYPLGTVLAFRVMAILDERMSRASETVTVALDGTTTPSGSAPLQPRVFQATLSTAGTGYRHAYLAFENREPDATIDVEYIIESPEVESAWTTVASYGPLAAGRYLDFHHYEVNRNRVTETRHLYRFRVRKNGRETVTEPIQIGRSL